MLKKIVEVVKEVIIFDYEVIRIEYGIKFLNKKNIC